MRAPRPSRLAVVAGSLLITGALSVGAAPVVLAAGPPTTVPGKSAPAKPAKKSCPWYKFGRC